MSSEKPSIEARTAASAAVTETPAPPCDDCAKPAFLCACQDLQSQRARLRVLILQHPQEPDKWLGSAPLLAKGIQGARLRVGLSWPNLSKAWDPTGAEKCDPREWTVVYLGNAKGLAKTRPASPLVFVDKKGQPVEDQSAPRKATRGLIVLDGTWSQAKTLWWRNAWLLKCWRAALVPQQKSLYRELRKEPSRECVSTLESTALALTELGESPRLEAELRGAFDRMLGRYRDWQKVQKESRNAQRASRPPKTENPA